MEMNAVNACAFARAGVMDVGNRAVSRQEVSAESTVLMQRETLERIAEMTSDKGDVFTVSRIAGLMAAKRAHELLPMCPAAVIEELRLTVTPVPPDAVHIVATALSLSRAGVEMTAMTAASVAALTLFDLLRTVDSTLEITATRIARKRAQSPYTRL